MAGVYILYSKKLDKYYVGSCMDITERFSEHLNKKYKDSFTSNANDWVMYFFLDNLEYKQARLIEDHIKKMKSKKYIEDLKTWPEISKRLLELYR